MLQILTVFRYKIKKRSSKDKNM